MSPARPHVRFVILSHPRSGCLTLQRTLTRNPAVHCAGLAFAEPVDLPPRILLNSLDSNEPHVSASGCTIYYDHLGAREQLLGALSIIPKLHVIELKRHNRLRRLVEQQQPGKDPVRFTPDQLIAEFQKRARQEEEARLALRHATWLHVNYEELITHPAMGLAVCQNFLSVAPDPLELACKVSKFLPPALCDAIENYDQLVHYFVRYRAGEYAAYFDEN